MTLAIERKKISQELRNKGLRKTALGAGLTAILSLLVLGLAGCSSSSNNPPAEKSAQQPAASSTQTENQPVTITQQDRDKAKDIFANRCAACHGPQGRGDGPGAANLNPRPANFQEKTWQATITDADIEKAILYGGAAVGKSPMMVANPDLQSQPGTVAALRELIRQLATPQGTKR